MRRPAHVRRCTCSSGPRATMSTGSGKRSAARWSQDPFPDRQADVQAGDEDVRRPGCMREARDANVGDRLRWRHEADVTQRTTRESRGARRERQHQGQQCCLGELAHAPARVLHGWIVEGRTSRRHPPEVHPRRAGGPGRCPPVAPVRAPSVMRGSAGTRVVLASVSPNFQPGTGRSERG
jgi:hypothetical protein